MKSPRWTSMPLAALALTAGLAFAAQEVTVYKNEGCGCCELWIRHLQKEGYTVKARDVPDTSRLREKFGIPEKLGACHTATVAGYVIEGHVPAREIKRLLKERPAAKGLAVPGMPIGSPGMPGDKPQPFDVLLVKSDGTTAVYRSYHQPK